MYLDLYKIDGTKNLDANPCFDIDETYPNFQGLFRLSGHSFCKGIVMCFDKLVIIINCNNK